VAQKSSTNRGGPELSGVATTGPKYVRGTSGEGTAKRSGDYWVEGLSAKRGEGKKKRGWFSKQKKSMVGGGVKLWEGGKEEEEHADGGKV